MKINKVKSEYKKTEIEILGHKISKNTLMPTIERGQGIINYQQPINRKQLQRYLGIINYDRCFIQDIAQKCKVLYDLLSKEKKFKWEKVEQECFESIKSEYQKNLKLHIPDFYKEFVLETDASDFGIGGVLRQKGLAISYLSKSLKANGKNIVSQKKSS